MQYIRKCHSSYDRYAKLKEADIKQLVIHDKWLATLAGAVHGEMDRISQALARRVKELADRYETSLPVMADDTKRLEKVVQKHLERMGFAWK